MTESETPILREDVSNIAYGAAALGWVGVGYVVLLGSEHLQGVAWNAAKFGVPFALFGILIGMAAKSGEPLN